MATNGSERNAHSANVDYVQAMLTWLRDDMRQVYIRTTAAVGLAVVAVNQLTIDRIVALSQFDRWVFGVGVFGLVVSAFLSFVYVGRTHVQVRETARRLGGSTDSGTAYDDTTEVFDSWKWVLWSSNSLFFASAGAMLFTVGNVLKLF